MKKNSNFIKIWGRIKLINNQIHYFVIVKYLFLILIAFFFTLPFYLMINMSFKSIDDINSNNLLLPPKYYYFHFSNYKEVFQGSLKFFKFFFNTCQMVFFSTLLGTLCCILTAFALSFFSFKYKKTILILLFLSLMITNEILVLTNYKTVASLGWLNNYFVKNIALIIPFLINIVHILLLIRNFERIPKELYYTAKIDGTSDWKYLWKILVPISKPTIMITVIFRIVAAWNAYSWPNLIGFDLLTTMARNKFNSESGIDDLNIQMAVAVLINLPLLFIFIFFKKYIISGENSSGIKG